MNNARWSRTSSNKITVPTALLITFQRSDSFLETCQFGTNERGQLVDAFIGAAAGRWARRLGPHVYGLARLTEHEAIGTQLAHRRPDHRRGDAVCLGEPGRRRKFAADRVPAGRDGLPQALGHLDVLRPAGVI